MAKAKRGSKRNIGKAALALGAAGVSFAMTGGASATAPPTNESQDNARRIFLGEEEISDVSLATFHVFDKENESLLRHGGIRVAAGHGGCGGCGHGGGCGGCAPMLVAAAAFMRAAASMRVAVAALFTSVALTSVAAAALHMSVAALVTVAAARVMAAEAAAAAALAAERGSGLLAWAAPPAPDLAGNGTRTWAGGSTSATKQRTGFGKPAGAGCVPALRVMRSGCDMRHPASCMLLGARRRRDCWQSHPPAYGRQRCALLGERSQQRTRVLGAMSGAER